MKTIIAVVQARTGSTRLPGKVLCDLAGEPLLARVVARLQRASTLQKVVIATTTLPGDDPIAALCAQEGWACFRGSEHDVLERYYQAALEHDADVVVRITSDCPLIDAEVVDLVVEAFLTHTPPVDYATNTLPPRTFPRGLDTEVMSFAALERAWREAQSDAEREHVTPYLYRNPGLFALLPVINQSDLSGLRWTVDTPEDLQFVRHIFDFFEGNDFSWRDVLRLLEAHPDWQRLNQHIAQKELGA